MWVGPGSRNADWPGQLRYVLVQHEYLALLVPVQTDEDSDLQVAGELMSLVLDAFAESWDTAGMTLCQISDFSVRPIQGLLRVLA